ncbi:hypothetical protein A2Z00_04885 [Candidatus Gottesmanbacteria bacterium RBG_13_45_10]|uniref:Class I SAM-dependent methyltransferase n=1 Tax=Candidatus Gottesmanbacteria bacterium RBG_13_45_10 TaxID=1798370 RepID=A0A1F5ZHG1_9BACT|nr:MAG: hypothetical protein A2Z00_04885 [Candidatus Gottesmanbacteria bacterium RBG_13_45_10]
MDTKTYAFVSKIPGWLTKHEGQFLEKAARSVKHIDGEIVEIGSYCGKSTIWLARESSAVYAVDPHKGEVSGGKTAPTLPAFLRNLEIAGVRDKVIPIVKTSKTAVREWHKPIALLFIDGLHDYEHALEDMSFWSRFVVSGGIVAMHDAFCGWIGAGDIAMRHIVRSPDYSEIGVVGSIIYGKKGKQTLFTRICNFHSQFVIQVSQNLYRSRFVPKFVAFFLAHRLLRILLINRYTSLP